MPTRPRRPIRPFALLPPLLAAALLLVAGAGIAKAPKLVRVRTAHNAQLHRTVLTTAHGRTLYSLSSEVHGHFDCTGSCLSVWKPLLVPRGAKLVGPKGLKGLKTVRRPDTHRRQATYRGHPVYTFTGDMKKGDANGEGVRDVGVWHAASPPKPKPAQQPAPTPAPAPSPTPTY
jgi:predicted lipoprotein with Yx(FWY)xxD motif